MTWQRTYARWRPLTKAAIEDHPSNLMEITFRSMVDELRQTLRDEAGWRTEDLYGPLAPNVTLRVSDDHADFYDTNTLALMVETRALQLLNPCPLPNLRLLRRR